MKILRSKAPREGGNALIATVIVTAVVGTALTAYLTMVKNQNASTMRSQAWNNSMPVIEAGIEDALSHLAVHGETNLACDNWTQAGSVFYMKRWVGDHYYVVTISNWVAGMTNQPVVESRGFVTMPVVASAGGPILAQVFGAGTKKYLGRGVRAQAKQDFIFSKGLVAKDTIDLNGNDVETDSFDSMDPAASTNGQYNVNMRKFNGDIASNSMNTNGVLVDVGNANIRGKVSTGPGGKVDIGANGKVGDASWFADATKTGFQEDPRDDMNVDFKDVEAPFTVGTPPAMGVVGTTAYRYVLTSGNYAMSSLRLNSSEKMIVTGNASLYVGSALDIGGTDAGIIIAPGASLKLYIAAPRADIGGSGFINQAGYATNLFIYGLPSCTQISVNGNGSFTGCIYAPQAHLTLNGGGVNGDDFMGAAVVRKATMNGHFKFHYDEALRIKGPPRGYVVTAWNEMSPAEIAATGIDYTDVGVIY